MSVGGIESETPNACQCAVRQVEKLSSSDGRELSSASFQCGCVVLAQPKHGATSACKAVTLPRRRGAHASQPRARRVPFGAEQCISATLNTHSALHVWKQCTELALGVQHYAPCEEAFNSPNRGSPSFRRLPALPASHHSSNTVLPCSRAAISMFCYHHRYNLNFLALSRREIAR